MTHERRAQTVRVRTMALMAILAVGVAALFAQAGAATPGNFRTSARFSVDAEKLQLQTAVATIERHPRFKELSWIHVYYYAFPLTTDDVAAVSAGNVAALERKQRQPIPGGPDANHSRAVVHLLLDKDSMVSNASLELPGLTCTIVVEPSTASKAIQVYEFDGKRLHLVAKGTASCDLTSISGGKRAMGWDTDVTLPVFAQR